MIKFKELFSFSEKEIKTSFQHATLNAKIYGIKLLKAPSSSDFGKILIVIPGKSGKAHDRNKFKRQIKAIFYEEQLYKKPINSIILVYKSALKLTFEQIKQFLVENLS